MSGVAENITAVLVSYNSAEILPRSIEALKLAGVTHIIVVDNASDDESVSVAQNFGAQVLINPNNLGFGVAANIGFAAVKTPYAYLVNPDCLVAQDSVQILLDSAESLPETPLFAPLLYDEDGSPRVPGGCILATFLQKSPKRKVIPQGAASFQMLSGAAMLFRMAFFPNGTIFDDTIFLYFEDDVVCRNVYDKGASCVLEPASKAMHIGNVSSPMTMHLQYWKGWHMAWSQSYVFQKYGIKHNRFENILKFYPRIMHGFLFNKPFRTAYAKGFLAGAKAFQTGILASKIRIPKQ